jgi:hypothetical protein
MAWRSEPAPPSFVFVTVKVVWAWTMLVPSSIKTAKKERRSMEEARGLRR